MTVQPIGLSTAARRAAMDGIVIESPRVRLAHEKFDSLVEHAALSEERRCIALLAPSQSGKTTIINSYVRRLNTIDALDAGEIPALKVTLQANITRRQFAQDILFAFERHGYNAMIETGTEAQLLRRAVNYLQDRKVRILFLDEFHHLVHSDNRKVVMSVSETVKHLLITGSCPIVVAGLHDARKPFDANRQLAHRAEAHLELLPLDPMSPKDRQMFRNFLSDYLEKADQLAVAEGLPNLLRDDVPACIWEVSRGVLGAACNLIKAAVQVAAQRGQGLIEREHLVVATDEVIRNRLYDRNPFRDGLGAIRPLEQVA
jgi:Cdc6-like AAA superfamily ATPase